MPSQPTKRPLLRAAAFTLLALAAPLSMAQTWPARPIRLVVPFPPGGLIDNMARLVGTRLSQELGQPVVIDNKPGAGGNVGAAEAARAPADGYTLLMASPALTISQPSTRTCPTNPHNLRRLRCWAGYPMCFWSIRRRALPRLETSWAVPRQSPDN